MDGARPDALSDAQLDRELDAALGVEPSPGFLARVRTRVAGEPQPLEESVFSRLLRPQAFVESGFSRILKHSVEPKWAVAIVGIVLAVVASQLIRDRHTQSPPDTLQVALKPRTAEAVAPADPLPVSQGQHSIARPTPPARSASAENAERRGVRDRSFEEQILLAPADREAFDRMLIVVSDPTIELIAPVLESARATADVLDAAMAIPALAAPKGVSQ
jgi:hypothetical protein